MKLGRATPANTQCIKSALGSPRSLAFRIALYLLPHSPSFYSSILRDLFIMAHSAQLKTDSCPLHPSDTVGKIVPSLQSVATTFISLCALALPDPPHPLPQHTQFGQPDSAAGLVGLRTMTAVTSIRKRWKQKHAHQDRIFSLCATAGDFNNLSTS